MTLRADTALYGSAVLLDRLLGFFMLPLLTRAVLPADYGAWTQTAISAGMLVPLVLFGLPTAVVRFFAASAGAASSRRWFVRLGGVPVVLGALIALLAVAISTPLARWVYGEAGRETLVLPLLALLAADATSEYAQAWLRAAGRMGYVAAVLVLRSLVRYGVVLTLVSTGSAAIAGWLGSYAAVQCALSAAALATAFAVLRRMPAPPEVRPAPAWRELLVFAAPLVLLSAFTALNAYLDRFVLVQQLGLDTVAVYSAAVSLCTVPAVFYSVLGFTLFPVLARHWAEQRRDEAARLMGVALRVFLFLCVPVAWLLAATGTWALPLLTTGAYAAEPIVFALLGVAVTAFGVYQILLYALLLGGRSTEVLLLAMAATATNLSLNLTLVPRFGLAGAAAAAAASNGLICVLAAWRVRAVVVWAFPWAGLWTITWRAALAGVPVVLLPAQPAWPLALAALLLAGVIYLGLDWARPASNLRTLLFP
jgi:O-antigen/teichoic acid export membrane protein